MPVAGHTSVKFSLGSLELWLLRRSMHAQCVGGGLRPARVWPVAARSMVARRLAQAPNRRSIRAARGPHFGKSCPAHQPAHTTPAHSTPPPQVLSRDIRSVTQRLKVPLKVQQGRAGVTLQYGASGAPAAPPPSTQGQAGSSGSGAGSGDGGGEGIFHVDLDGVHIRYDVMEGERAVVLRSAAVGER